MTRHHPRLGRSPRSPPDRSFCTPHRTRNTYLAAQFRRFAKNAQSKAAFAVAHTLIVSIWHMLAQGVDYADGTDHFDRRINIAAHTHLCR